MADIKKTKQTVIKDFATEKGDTGSAEVQVGLLSFDVDNLKEHIDTNPHDNPSKRALINKIAKRRRLLKYLANLSQDRYGALIKKVGLKK